MLATRFSLVETAAGWEVREQDEPVLTPMGHPVTTRHRALAERIVEDARLAGTIGHDQPTAYSLQVWYHDFGRTVPIDHLRGSVLAGLDPRWDLASNRPTDPRLAEAAREAYQLDGDDLDLPRLRPRLEALSRRQLLSVVVFASRFQSARLGLGVVTGTVDLERLSLGTCVFVAERRVARSLQGDARYYAPLLGRRETFCRDHCLPRIAAHPADDVADGLTRSTRNCAMHRVLEGFRFFASFADE